MSKRTAELVSEWDSEPFEGGYDGLRTLADREFSGAVVAGSTRLFMLNGTVVGILDGDLETFEGAGGTARRAPHESLPLLVVMQARAEDPRAQYYTEDTPIEKVDRTLSDGNFTGFVELSENVLSGDYYLVYHQGRSMSVAWVGSSERLITDDEAFEQANDEVGIYDVIPAEIEITELPGTDTGSTNAGGGVDDAGTDVGGVPDSITGPATDTADADSGAETNTPGADAGAGANAADTDASTGTDDTPERVEDMTLPGAGPPGEESGGTTEQSASTPDSDSGAGASGADDTAERGSTPSGPPGSKAAGASQGTAVDSQTGRSQRDEPERAAGSSTSSSGTDRVSSQQEPEPEPTVREASGVESPERASEPAETDSVTPSSEPTQPDSVSQPSEPAQTDSTPPSPETSQTDSPSRAPDTTAADSTASESDGPVTAPSDGTTTPASTPDASAANFETRSIPSLDPGRSESTPQSAQFPAETDTESADTTATDPEPVPQTEPSEGGVPAAEVEAKLDEREATIARLENEIAELSADKEELAAERDRLATQLEEARAEIQRLETQLQETAQSTPDGARLSAEEAIAGTNLFVRYRSKGEGTLSQAQDGGVDRSTVDENLRLEYHTQFDGENASVDGTAFETFLQESIHYRFANWLVRELLYEIRDTGHAGELSVLYDALPKVDRAELNGNVSVTYTEDGQEHREQQEFDVVVRDRMGNPLVVANINESRQPATEGQMTDIIRDAERVGTTSDSLAAAFLVTSSFFEPGALETAEEATSSGLFSRDKHKSFVNLSRKGGYHLCLLEARNDEFHLAVPEL